MATGIARSDLLVVGAGPAGLGAAAEAARYGVRVLLADEHDCPGGQLFKQIHKFFGSEAHHAGVRGYDIGRRLLAEAAAAGVELMLGARAVGLLEGRRVLLVRDGRAMVVEPACIVLATGARENALAFPGWTLPGVMTAGAAQTMVNLHGALPGRDVVIVGGGNVGLIVAYQLAQAGARVRAVVEIAPSVGGYYVHAAKVQRWGVPILTSHAVVRAVGSARVEAVEVAPVEAGASGAAVRTIPADTVCLAVGLTPRSELAALAGCGTLDCPALGGPVPVHSDDLETTAPGVFVAGDVAGVEEASTALDEGRLAGLTVAERLGKLTSAQAGPLKDACRARLRELRSGRDHGRLDAKLALAGAYADARRAAGRGCRE